MSPRLRDLNCPLFVQPGLTPGWGGPAGGFLTRVCTPTQVWGGGGGGAGVCVWGGVGDGRGYHAATGSHPFFSGGRPAHSTRPQNGEPGYGLEALEGSRRRLNSQGPRAPGASRLPGTAPGGAGTRTCLPPRDGVRCDDLIAEPRKRELASTEARAGWR